MARRSAAATADTIGPAPTRVAALLGAMKQVASAAMVVTCLVAVVWVYLTVDNFLVTDSRFFLPGPPEPGERSDTFQIEGIRNVTDEQIIQAFGRDFGRSIFLCPIRERRLKLLGIDWVKEASIQRLWPNRLVIHVKERTPAAFVQTPAADGALMLTLVDADGVLLDPQRARAFRLPVLTGITRSEGEASRRERMKRFLRMQAELGSYMEKISEIDVSQSDNLKVIQQFDDRALTLMLGNQHYRERYENFVNNHEEIRNRLPDAVVLDLRLKDRITAVGAVTQPTAKTAGSKATSAKPGATKSGANR
jgi:cell division protein FtsQ